MWRLFHLLDRGSTVTSTPAALKLDPELSQIIPAPGFPEVGVYSAARVHDD